MSIPLSWFDGETKEFKFNAGKIKKQVKVTRKGDRLWFTFGYCPPIQAAIKQRMRGYKWHGYETPPVMKWSVENCQRNAFQIAYLAGMKPYAHYDQELVPYKAIGEAKPPYGLYQYDFSGKKTRPMFGHQAEMTAHILTYKQVVIGGEMGTGKTLSAIQAMELSGKRRWLWVGPKAALSSVELEFMKWASYIKPTFCTYSSLARHNEEWEDGLAVYDGIIFDESSRLKNAVTKRSIASQYLADNVRLAHGYDGYVVEMTGTPAPKSPLDWYSQTEIACPGFLAEGHQAKLKDRLAVIDMRDSAAGGVYPHLVTWLDDKDKCTVCGDYEDSEYHWDLTLDNQHTYKPSKVNEVLNLHNRMRGLVLIKLKKDCLDLPEKQYKRVYCKPTRKTLSAARLIQSTAGSAIKALTALRQLSDGFLYSKEETGSEECPTCKGNKTVAAPSYIGPDKTEDYIKSIIQEPIPTEDWSEYPIDPVLHPDLFEESRVSCYECNGTGQVKTYARTTDTLNCPKRKALKGIIEEHQDIGRLVIFGGYTGSVDICVEVVTNMQWDYIRVDGRGWKSSLGELSPVDLLQAFQNREGKVAFIGQPSAAGMGLTLTASPTIVYYSNDFNAESRLQSEDRIHRPGMDVSRGATIIDLIHLPSDEKVLNNLKKKIDLQKLTMGDIVWTEER
jgi:SNF2 family DNA or RNA helicase